MVRSSWRDGARLTLLAAVALWPRAAHAAPEAPVDVDLTYEAPAECPPRSDLLGELQRRVDPSWRTGLDRRSFVVRIERLPQGTFAGRLGVARASGTTQTREFRADTCRAVSTALVVFIAIALDPANAEPEAEPPPTPPPPPPPAPPPPATTPQAPSKPPRREPPPRARARPLPSAWVWSSAVSGAYLRAPGGALGARIDAQLARSISGSRIAPALRLSWGFADLEELPRDGGRASFRFQTLRASACAVVSLAPTPLTVAPCAGIDAGALDATSDDLPQVGHASAAWYAAAGAVRLSWAVLPWLSLEGEVGFLAPFTRPAFALVEPIRIVYRPPPILLTTGAGIAIQARFP